MPNARYPIRDTRYEPGFTIVELLIALAIMALLLGAVAVAFNASVINYSENEDIFKTINNARQALFRITTQLRTASAVEPNSPANECTLITDAGEDITYRYNSAESKLYLIDNSTASAYLLCDDITAMTFTANTATEGSLTYVKGVQISITVQSGDIQKTISAATVIRKNLK
jgi:prepilin-type N-terminal cleavage/methylation domain-containing protein